MAPRFTHQSIPLSSRLRPNRMRSIAKHSEAGLTLIESLIAMVVIAITMVSITPPIFWAVGSRVQTHRAEQALKLAQGEIDRVRVVAERGEMNSVRDNSKLLPPVKDETTKDVRQSSTIAAPTASQDSKIVSKRRCGTNSADNADGMFADNVNNYVRVDVDGDCRVDFLVQTFRTQGLDQSGKDYKGSAGQVLSGFVMGVRVYAAVAEPALIAKNGKTTPASLKGTNGLGNQLDQPLAVLYSTIVRSNESQNLDLYRKLCPTESKTTGSC